MRYVLHIGKSWKEHMYVLHRVCIWWNFFALFYAFSLLAFRNLRPVILYSPIHWRSNGRVWLQNNCSQIFWRLSVPKESRKRHKEVFFFSKASFAFITKFTALNAYRSVFVFVLVFSRTHSCRCNLFRHDWMRFSRFNSINLERGIFTWKPLRCEKQVRRPPILRLYGYRPVNLRRIIKRFQLEPYSTLQKMEFIKDDSVLILWFWFVQ